VLLTIKYCKAEEPDKTEWGWYAACAFMYVTSMVASNMALRWVNYPTQVVAKCSKPIPVMILGVLLAHKRYTIQKYFFVLMIVTGVILFVYKDKGGDSKDESPIGLILIGVSLLADGVLGAIEDRMRAATKPAPLDFMFSINMFSAVILVIASVCTTEIIDFYEFAQKYPDVIYKIFSAAVVGSIGQVFIFSMISFFGPLPCRLV